MIPALPLAVPAARAPNDAARASGASAPTAPDATLDAAFMVVAIELARQGSPAPNPHVGAIVVQRGEVVGVGHHERAGTAHAEALAISRAGADAHGATLYVTLEPCNHHGRTPPCVDAILHSGIRRVVIGCPDPNPHVKGGGADALRRAGIEVSYGHWEAAAEKVIAEWKVGLRRS